MKAYEDLTVTDILDTLTEKQEETFSLLVGYALDDPEYVPSKKEQDEITAVLNTMNKMQTNVLHYVVGQALGDVNSKVEALVFLERMKN